MLPASNKAENATTTDFGNNKFIVKKSVKILFYNKKATACTVFILKP